MRVVKIYALINPYNNRKFYIGATEQSLNERLMQHLAVCRMAGKCGQYIQDRKCIYQKSIEIGRPIRIILLEEVKFSKSNEAEKRWFDFYSRKNTLSQKSPGDFRSQSVWPRLKK